MSDGRRPSSLHVLASLPWRVANRERQAQAILDALHAAGYVVVPREAVAAATTFMLATEGHLYPSDERHLATLVDALGPDAPRGSTQTPLERQYEVAKRRNVGLDRFSLAPRRKATK